MNQKETVLLFGLGGRFFENRDYIEKTYNIAGIVDCDYSKHGKYEKYDVVAPSKIGDYSFDKIVITPRKYQSILAVLQAKNIPNEQLRLLVCENDYGHIWRNVYKMPLYEGGKVNCCFDDIHFQIKYRCDQKIMDDIFQKNGWDFCCKEKVVVVDIGMNIGLASLYFANMENVECVYGYEPFAETYRQAQDNFSRNSKSIQSKIKSMNYGLTDRESQIEVFYNPLNSTNMRVDNGKRIYGANEEKVRIKTVSAAAEIQKIIERHKNLKIVLKVDCEGAEYPIFQDLAKNGILKEIYLIMMETHDGRENEIKQCLKAEGFLYFDNYAGHSKVGFLYAVNAGKSE